MIKKHTLESQMGGVRNMLLKQKVSRSAFTQVELIFVMVIIGILASVAIPRLAATRNNAKLAATVHNMSVCITDVAAQYIANGTDATATNHPSSCDIEKTKCYTITYAQNGQNFVVATNPSADSYCTDIDNIGGHLAKSYDFRGTRISL